MREKGFCILRKNMLAYASLVNDDYNINLALSVVTQQSYIS